MGRNGRGSTNALQKLWVETKPITKDGERAQEEDHTVGVEVMEECVHQEEEPVEGRGAPEGVVSKGGKGGGGRLDGRAGGGR